jgi:hypothetical protein
VKDGDYIYTAGGGPGGGLWVFDVVDPTNPIHVGTFDSGGAARGIAIDGPFLHLTGTEDKRYRILDISDPTSPMEVVYTDVGGIMNRVAIDPPFVWAVSSHHGGLLKFSTNVVTAVHREHSPSFSFKQNYPNPFNPSTTIEFSIPRSTVVKLTIFNARGERIATLVNESRPAGVNRIVWNGTNDHGEQVSSGVYFCRIRVLGIERVNKIVYLK